MFAPTPLGPCRKDAPLRACTDHARGFTATKATRTRVALLLVCVCGGAASALDREQQHGQELLDTLCARCHAVGETGRSPVVDAPPFRSFSDRKLYDEDFSQRLQNGLSTIHPDMPTFRFNRSDAEAAVNYLKAIQQRSKPK
jgi:mono/diheme cytochrome c family protein